MIPDDDTTTAPRSSRRDALGGLIATPLVLPGILSSASFVAASAGPASAASEELESEVTSKVFFDFAVDGQPVGRVVVGVFGKANPIAAARFATLAKGVQGLSYKRTEVNAVDYNGRAQGYFDDDDDDAWLNVEPPQYYKQRSIAPSFV